jgi:3-dehydroquinate synthase
MRHMMQDKKAEAGRLTLVLARAIGKAFVARNVDRETLHKFLIAEGAMG